MNVVTASCQQGWDCNWQHQLRLRIGNLVVDPGTNESEVGLKVSILAINFCMVSH